MDLQAHQLQTHGQAMGSKERKDKRRIDTGFTFEDVRNGRNRGGPGSSGNALPSSSSAPAPGGSRRAAFGGHLTTSDEQNTSQPDEHADVVLQTSE